jgi:hypothetical protein
MKIKNKIPENLNDWLDEISRAYNDAFETIPFMPLTGTSITTKEIFHFGPAICLKFRGIKATENNMEAADEAALSSYVATEENVDNLFEIPQMAFAFSYLASHFGLDILTDTQVSEIMGFLENNKNKLISITCKG